MSVIQFPPGAARHKPVPEHTTEPFTLDTVLPGLRLQDLCRAVDAHALVSITDARGVIAFANDKFCSTSGYTRDELIGHTHHIVNSGQHPRAFFDDLWRAITSGATWRGEICNRARNGSLYWVESTLIPFLDDTGVLLQCVSIQNDVTERRNLAVRMKRMAYQDSLTGLPNRRFLMESLRRDIGSEPRKASFGALLLLDLDDFKDINDTMGHSRGDQLLQSVAARLTTEVRPQDTVVRFGGDEFVVVLPDLGTDLEGVLSTARRAAGSILAALKRPVWINGSQVSRTASIGLVTYRGGDITPDWLLQRADIALYQSKSSGRDCLTVFDAQLESAFQSAAELRDNLRGMVREKRFALHFQTIVDADRKAVGAEALIRLHHPVRGIIPPSEFIPELEKAGEVDAIGEFVLTEACRRLGAWHDDPARRGLYIAVNISPRHFRSPNFLPFLLELLDRHQLCRGSLVIEITEGSLLTDVEDAIRKMRILKRHGVRFAIDDFGTGYSSMGYLKQLPIDIIKLDRAFVRDVVDSGADGAIVRAVLDLSRGLGLQMVAEGVETTQQFNWLRGTGCRLFQGFLFSRPQPDLERILDGAPATIPEAPLEPQPLAAL